MRKGLISLSNFLSVAFLFCILLGSQQSSQAEVIYANPLIGAEKMIGNMLEWSTMAENNSQMFIVEKSLDGVDFQNIGVVDAAGISAQEKGYRFLDINAGKEKAFYRLRQLDQDGTGSFSQTVMITRNLSNNFMVVAMSNTTTNKIFEITLDAIDDGSLEYEVSTLDGEQVFQKEIALEFGLNTLLIDLENEQEGAYKIRLQSGDEQEWLLVRKGNINAKVKENVASKRSANGG